MKKELIKYIGIREPIICHCNSKLLLEASAHIIPYTFFIGIIYSTEERKLFMSAHRSIHFDTYL